MKGVIHSHSNWSDGGNVRLKNVNAAKESGFEYLVISDHSKSAFYTRLLAKKKLRKAQHKYYSIDELNAKILKFFKSIESDIRTTAT